MTIAEARPRHVPPCPGVPPQWRRAHRVVAWALLAAWFGLAASTLLLGTKDSTYADLRDDLASGRVDHVEVVGDSVRGPVELRWRAGLVEGRAWVTETRSDRQLRQARRGGDAAVLGDVEDHLLRLDPDLGVTSSGGSGSHPSWMFAGFHLPGGIVLGWLTLVVCCWVMASAAWTWRATPWAWGWLILLLPPYGIVAFLLLGGPTGAFPPRDPHRRWLTGGWAFLLALVLAGPAAGT